MRINCCFCNRYFRGAGAEVGKSITLVLTDGDSVTGRLDEVLDDGKEWVLYDPPDTGSHWHQRWSVLVDGRRINADTIMDWQETQDHPRGIGANR